MKLLAAVCVALCASAVSEGQSARELSSEGRRALGRRDAESLSTALQLFERSIEAEPGFALAWSGLADAHALLGDYEAARRAARRALRLDPDLGEAHASLGFVLLHADWNWATAERHLTRAVELAPEHLNGRLWLAIAREIAGRHEEAVAEARAAVEVASDSPPVIAQLGYRLYWARKYPEAVATLESALELDPALASAHYFVGRALAEQGEHEPALQAFVRADRLSPRDANIAGAVGYLMARWGRPEEARLRLRALEPLAEEGLPVSTQIASILAALGQSDAALGWLERAYRRREGPMAWLAVDPRFEGLGGAPRMVSLLKRMGLRS